MGFLQLLHHLPIMQSRKEERYHCDGDDNQRILARPEGMPDWLPWLLLPRILKELIDGKPEADQRHRCPNPGHQCPLVGEMRTLQSEFRRIRKVCRTRMMLDRHCNSLVLRFVIAAW